MIFLTLCYRFTFFLRIITYAPENIRDRIIPAEAEAWSGEISFLSKTTGVEKFCHFITSGFSIFGGTTFGTFTFFTVTNFFTIIENISSRRFPVLMSYIFKMTLCFPIKKVWAGGFTPYKLLPSQKSQR